MIFGNYKIGLNHSPFRSSPFSQLYRKRKSLAPSAGSFSVPEPQWQQIIGPLVVQDLAQTSSQRLVLFYKKRTKRHFGLSS